MSSLTAEQFINKLKTFQSDKERENIRKFFKGDGPDNDVIGVRMKNTFDTAKAFKDMPLDEVSKLLDSPYYEARMGAVSILDFKARSKKITEEEQKALYDMYMSRHDRINNWDLVDRSAHRVVGGYLLDKPRDVLFELAKSKNIWERRTAAVATWYFIMQNDIDDALRISEVLLHDPEELINKSVGTTLRYVGDKDQAKLMKFLDKHAHNMPRVSLRYAVEKFSNEDKTHYMNMGK